MLIRWHCRGQNRWVERGASFSSGRDPGGPPKSARGTSPEKTIPCLLRATLPTLAAELTRLFLSQATRLIDQQWGWLGEARCSGCECFPQNSVGFFCQAYYSVVHVRTMCGK